MTRKSREHREDRGTPTPTTPPKPKHPITGRFLAFDCEIDCLVHCAGLCGANP